ncbi:MAG: hypothetical protein EOP04_16905 [Proteobacteria bacterium]|nr:MAG: hypothetical protein EOP04_16905 [Pseudomonadota bacterium]
MAESSDDVSKLKIISWNIKHFGRANLNLEAAAKLISEVDIVTFQEVNKSSGAQDALKKISGLIASATGEKICWGLSELPTEGKERYAYLWKNARISYVKTDGTIISDCTNTAVTIRLGVKHAEKIVREPSFGTFYFKSEKRHFVLASIHLLPTAKGPAKEIGPLFDTFAGVDQPLVIAGDFNMDSNEVGFADIQKQGFLFAMSEQKTTIKKKSREMSKAYDNFWFRNIKLKSYKVLDLLGLFPQLEISEINRTLSDHCPIQADFEFIK